MTPSTVPGPTGVRVATLRLRRVDPWSAMKTGFVFALGLGLMYVVAALLLFLFASATGVFESFNSTFSELSGTDGPFTFGIVGVLTVSLVFAVVEVIVTTLLIAVLALLYNASASVTGGVMVKLAED
ncbi:MAG TPA: DUF3566 domain-containing protein [Actinomycetota bacterium]|nr:DUF3566 domain-containing protein [Candidatus Nanopelagicales bacterium]HPE13125.1 DUF3566 domain-containing protein [Actinomycetota bacterium]HPJ17702.1 DUF3566 domain-containing protein [Actinomycetota bacterium]HPQ85695.1 DUF3566 domain-containing protein [Actinomycetota bacterium]HRV66508.1 DUF3566 domain-containing protein [Candidatus Nanopelagicales bacterium]